MGKILVTGATGFQGSAVVKELVKDGFTVKGLIRNAEGKDKISSLGAEAVIGSFDDEASLVAAFAGVDKVVISFPLIFDESILMKYAENVVSAWKKSQVKLFVFNANTTLSEQKSGTTAADIKRAIEHYFDAQKLPYISLRPTLYMDNLAAPFLLPVIQANSILPYPVSKTDKIAWISHRDLAAFIVEALKRPELAGKKFNIGGIQLISGEEMAAVISRYAGKKIEFVPMTPDQFEAQLTPAFGADAAREIAGIYRFVESHIPEMQVRDLRDRTLIDLPVSSLQTFDEWASQINWG